MSNIATDHIIQTDDSKYALALANSLGLTLTSGWRSKKHNDEVGGSKTSDHLKGTAYDFAGSRSSMLQLADKLYKTGKYKQIIFDNKDYKTGKYIGGHQDHVHVGWYADGKSSVAKPNDVGVVVGFIQKLLGGIKIDNIFGPATEKAVKDFQEKHGLTVDGKVGDLTWGKLTGSSKVFF